MATLYTELIDSLRMLLGDTAKPFRDTVTGNGSNRIFTLTHYPVKSTGYVVYFDNVVQSTGYTIDTESGTITFFTAPSDGVVVIVTYYFYNDFTNSELSQALRSAARKCVFANYSDWTTTPLQVNETLGEGDCELVCSVAALLLNPYSYKKWATAEVRIELDDSSRMSSSQDRILKWINIAKYHKAGNFTLLQTWGINNNLGTPRQVQFTPLKDNGE